MFCLPRSFVFSLPRLLYTVFVVHDNQFVTVNGHSSHVIRKRSTKLKVYTLNYTSKVFVYNSKPQSTCVGGANLHAIAQTVPVSGYLRKLFLPCESSRNISPARKKERNQLFIFKKFAETEFNFAYANKQHHDQYVGSPRNYSRSCSSSRLCTFGKRDSGKNEHMQQFR